MNAMFDGCGSNGAAYDEMFDGDALRPPYLRLSSSRPPTAPVVAELWLRLP
jgi:hypothetical protein